MISFETVLIVGLSVALAAGALIAVQALRRSGSGVSEHFDAGHFQQALDAARVPDDLSRDEILAAAMAARHLLEMGRGRELLARLVREDPRDGEAWTELALIAGYENHFEDAARALDQAAISRSDLLESLTLHRAWLALRRDDSVEAARLFAEVEAPLETKFQTDLGTGDPAFAEWFLQAGLLWRHQGEEERARWAFGAASEAAPESLLIAREIG